MLLSNGGLDSCDINQQRREINLGFYGLGKMFFEAKHDLACQLLQKWYGYKFYETRMKLNSTWCQSPEKTNKDFLHFNERFNEEKSKMIHKHHLN